MSASPKSCQDAFSLVEITMALGIVAFAVVVLMGLLPAGLSASREGASEELATEILTAAAADIRNTAPGETSSPLYGIPLNPPADLFFSTPGLRVSDGSSNSDFRVSLLSRTSANPALNILHLTVTWPPQAVPPSTSVETLIIRVNPFPR